MLAGIVLAFFGILVGAASPLENLQKCKKTKVEENVTLRGGLSAGTFRKLAKVTSMESCLELCCRNPSCDVAFMSGLKCYGVECVSDDECESTATDTSETKVLIAHVRTGKKKGNKSSVLAGIPTHNTMASKPMIGNPLTTKTIPGMQASTSLSPKSTTSGKQQAPTVNINPGMAGQCKAGVEHKEVTLKGGINAGTYKDIGAVPSIDECSKKCCSYAPCDLAFMLQGRCYLVGCTDGKSCQLQKAKASPYHPSVMYMTRWNNEGVKHTINVQDETSSNFMCSPMKLMKKVTLKGGLKSGDFTDTGKVGNIGECYDLCCQQPTCNLAFMLGQNCFSVKCFNKDLCSTIPAQPSIYNPQIAYVYNRKVVQPKDKAQPASKKSEIIKPAPKCPVGKVIERVTLVGGLNAGNFHDNGKVKDIQQCRRICCEMPKCNLAFMLGVNCFSVECKNAAVCKTQPAQPSQFFPRISYVRPIGSSKFMVTGDFMKLSGVSEPATKSDIPGLPAPASKPEIAGLPATKPAIPGSSAQPSKPVIPGLSAPDTKPAIPGLPAANKPALPLSSPANKAQIPPLSNIQAIPGLPGEPGIPQQPGLPQQTPIPGLPLQPSQTLEAALGKASVEPATNSNLNGLPGQPQTPSQQPKQLEQLLPGPSGKPDNPLLGQLPAGNPLADLPGTSQLPVQPTPTSQTTQVTMQQSQSPAPAQTTQIPQSVPEQKKTELPEIPTNDVSKKINLTSTINDAKPGQAMKMNIVDGKLQLTPVGTSKDHPKKNATSSAGAFDAILGGDDDTPNDKCLAAKIITDVTLKGGKKAGKFKDQGDVKNMKECKKLCCEDDKCNLAFMLEKTCYTVTCKSEKLCEHTPAPPSDFRPRISYVRPLSDTPSEPKDLPSIPKAPENLRCKYSNITNNKQFQGPMGTDNFTIQHDASNMPECMTKCCEDTKCDIAYYVQEKCYTVKCDNKDACKPIPVSDKTKDKIPLISAMIMKPKDEPDFVTDFESKSSASPEVTDLQTSQERCHSNRISTGITLTNQGSNFTSMGMVGSLKKCIALCCVRPACDIAYLHDDRCFAVHCNDGVMCQSNAHQADEGVNVKMAYMDRNKKPAKERDWMLVYMIVGALAFAAVIGGVIWGVCLCTKRNKIAKQRRLLDDDDEDDEMLPKPTQTRYRTPMHRY